MRKSTKSENEPILQKHKSKPRLPVRYVIVFMCCAANVLNYGVRLNLSIAMIAMVRRNKTSDRSTNVQYHLGEAEVFDWDMETQQSILGAFYYGYMITPILGGWLVAKFGGSVVVFIGVLMSSVTLLLTPTAAGISVGLFILTRIIVGMGQGIALPPQYVIVSKWSKLEERGMFISIATSGSNIGPVIACYLSAYLCSTNFLGGWPSVFYLYGIAGVIWCFFWCIIASDGASESRWISAVERDSILLDISQLNQNEEVNNVPWLNILTSPPVWAIVICGFAFDYGYFLLFTDVPIFFQTILGFEIRQTGLMTVFPQAVMFVTNVLTGTISDRLISRGIFSVISTRRLFAFLTFGVSSVLLVSIGYISDNVALAVFLMTATFGMFGTYMPNFGSNLMDIAPNYSGILIGMVLTVGSCGGFIAPTILGALTNEHNTIRQWRIVFWIVAGINAFGLFSFLACGSSELQEWSQSQNKEISSCKSQTNST